MSARSKTGGGVGTNQYAVKGRSVDTTAGKQRAGSLDTDVAAPSPIEFEGYTVNVWPSAGADGCMVVQIDTLDDDQVSNLRVNVNEDPVFGRLYASTDTDDDDDDGAVDPVVQLPTAIEFEGYTVNLWPSAGADGCMVVQIDTVDDDQVVNLRVNVNDDPAFGRPFS